jgi:SAM-dependent methyltransferase
MKVTRKNACSVNVCPACGHAESLSLEGAPDRFHGRRHVYHLVRCSSCSLVRTENPPPPSKIGEHYGAQYDKSVGGAGEDLNRWRGRCEVVERYKPGGAILDLGCNSGGFLGSLQGPTWRRYGIEMSEAAANVARCRWGTEVFVGDILDAPFPPDSFDVITCFHVLEHLYHPRDVLEHVSAWLKPGGIFYAMMPNIESAGAKLFGSYWYALELPRHICHFSPTSFAALAGSAGLESLSVSTHRELFVEQSTRYLLSEMLYRAGVSAVPLAQAKPSGIVWRVVRKAFRLTLLPILDGLASLAGEGESIHAILQKPLSATQSQRQEPSMSSASRGEYSEG